MKTTSKKQEGQENKALNELFLDEMKDIYWAEKHLVKALAKMSKNATSEEVRKAFEDHMAQTEGHVNRLEQAFESIGEKAKPVKCEAMEGLMKEAEQIMEETEKGTMVRDAALISAAQKVEHYEIASYGTLKTLAGILGYNDAAKLLEATLEEEKTTDGLLTQIAESHVNEAAAAE
jgi:ferritin-like metal-binding protein YciE